MEIPMHKSLKNFGLASAAMALVMAPNFVAAQEQGASPSMPETGTATTPPPATQADTMPDAAESTAPDTAMDGAKMNKPAPRQTISPAEQEAAIASWPAETQSYYLSLDDERKQMFWALADTDKVRLSQLPEEQREMAWNQIKAQIRDSQG
jgi:hypothetical protein